MKLVLQLQQGWLSLGRFAARRVTWGLALVFCLWAAADVMVFHVSSGLALSTYDAMVRTRLSAAAPDPRLLVVDIDEASLARMGQAFGQWPWPRDTLATVLDHIERQQPLAVVWDVMFSESDLQNPGGDAAFDAAVRQSPNSHFSVLRLPGDNDSQSKITRAVLPGLWATPARPPDTPEIRSTVALIPPALPAVAATRLGYNNGYVDADGVLRRFRYAERLRDGSVIQSLPLSVLSVVNPIAHEAVTAGAQVRSADGHSQGDELIAWRAQGNAYPRVAFADVFAVAEGQPPLSPVPEFAGKVVIIGSTAPGLHDIHPTPLSPYHHGVDSLATVLDNAINHRHLRELPRWVQALLACALFVGFGVWVGARGVSSLAPVTLILPFFLLAISYLSLNFSPLFVDLHLAAGLGLLFLASLRTWNTLRRDYWCRLPADMERQAHAAWPLVGRQAWADAAFDRLLSAVQHHAPECRVVAGDAIAVWPAQLHWPEMAEVAAIVGPADALAQALPALRLSLGTHLRSSGELQPVDPAAMVPTLFEGWSKLLNSGTPVPIPSTTERPP